MAQHWCLKLRSVPGQSTVSGDINFSNRAATRPGETADFVEARTWHAKPCRRACHDRFRSHLEVVPERLSVQIGPKDGVAGALRSRVIRFVDGLDASEPLDVTQTFKPW